MPTSSPTAEKLPVRKETFRDMNLPAEEIIRSEANMLGIKYELLHRHVAHLPMFLFHRYIGILTTMKVNVQLRLDQLKEARDTARAGVQNFLQLTTPEGEEAPEIPIDPKNQMEEIDGAAAFAAILRRCPIPESPQIPEDSDTAERWNAQGYMNQIRRELREQCIAAGVLPEHSRG